MQRVHFQVRVGTCFQLSTNLGKDFCRSLWYCGKKLIECGLTWHWWIPLICCLCIIIQKIAPQLPNMVFPPIWGEKMAALWACACKLSWALLSPAGVQPLYRGREKRRRRASARNVSFRVSLRWPFHIINSVDKTKLSCLTRGELGKAIIDYYEVSLFTRPLSARPTRPRLHSSSWH